MEESARPAYWFMTVLTRQPEFELFEVEAGEDPVDEPVVVVWDEVVGVAGALAAFSLSAAAVCALEGFTASTAPSLHKPPASSKNQMGSVLFTVTLMMGRPGASTGRSSGTWCREHPSVKVTFKVQENDYILDTSIDLTTTCARVFEGRLWYRQVDNGKRGIEGCCTHEQHCGD